MHNGKLVVEWDSYEMPSYGFREFGEKKKYGIVGGLGVVSDEVLPRISDKVEVYGIGARHLRGRDLPNIEEIDGYKVFRPFGRLSPRETIEECGKIFKESGFEFNGYHTNEIHQIPFLADYGLMIPQIRASKDPDIICAHDWMSVLGAYKKSKNLEKPLATFLHSLEPGRAGGMIHTHSGPMEYYISGVYGGRRTIRDIEAIGIAKSEVVFTVGTNMVEEVKKVGFMHGIKPEKMENKVFPIHHGVDTKIYRPIENLEKEYDVIFIGRFAHVKGVDELLDAIKILKNSRYSDIRVKMIGGGEMENDIKEKVKREHLENNIDIAIRWFSPEEKKIEINKAKIAVAPSKYEPHGQFDLEAGACGVPCINGNGGFMERMIHEVTALKCDPFDPIDIANKIEYLLSKSEKREEMGKNAREFTVKYYDWDERAAIYPDIFEAVVSGNLKRLEEIPLTVDLKQTEFALA